MNIAVIIGTRPEIIKMSPIIRELERRQLNFFIIHTGQHYSYNLDKIFFEQLKLPEVDYNLNVGSSSHSKQTAKILVGVESILQKESPDVILVEGDTNSVLAASLAAVKLHIPVGHVEAGLRSYDRKMPEEINRILTDHCSEYLFAPTEKAVEILLNEGIHRGKIFLTGNTIVDATYQNLEIAKKNKSSLDSLNIKPKSYLLTTIHREENVDNTIRFKSIIDSLDIVAVKFNLPLIYPIHPHSRKRMKEFNIKPKNITIVEPIDFLSFLKLESNAKLILTDSGGIQEEACILGVPCVTLRDNTERPETLEVGANMLAGISLEKILESMEAMLNRDNNWRNPFGNGRAAEKIIKSIVKGKDS